MKEIPIIFLDVVDFFCNIQASQEYYGRITPSGMVRHHTRYGPTIGTTFAKEALHVEAVVFV